MNKTPGGAIIDNETTQAKEPEHIVRLDISPDAVADIGQVKVKLNAISTVLTAVNKNIEETKNIAEDTKTIAEDTKKGVTLTYTSIIIGIIVAVFLFVANAVLIYAKII